MRFRTIAAIWLVWLPASCATTVAVSIAMKPSPKPILCSEARVYEGVNPEGETVTFAPVHCMDDKGDLVPFDRQLDMYGWAVDLMKPR